MTQMILPMIPKGATEINNFVSVFRGETLWTYFMGTYPIYFHEANDDRKFRLTMAQLVESGACRQVDFIRVFGVTKSKVIRAVNKYRKGGTEAFFEKRKGRRGGNILTPEVLEKAQALLDEGKKRGDVAEEINVKYDTLRKAINDGRLKERNQQEKGSTKSSRDAVDSAAASGMGVACVRTDERVLASMGKLVGATVAFETCLDVPKGGVLCAIPTLLANGLLYGGEQFLGKVKGYYTMTHVLLLLASMSLCRVKTTEKMRGQTPGEFGKLLGLDRMPEVRCLRVKMDQLSADEGAERWAAHLSKYWMEQEPEAVGALYVDGHVRVYNGGLTKLPRRFVSRERLCLRGITDYWVNDVLGRPFFAVEKVVDPGLLKTLREDIVPRLLNDVPNQPSDQELSSNPMLCRFFLVFDREGYSPAFFSEMWTKHRIACLTYHKHPGTSWPEEWFVEHEVPMPKGEVIDMKLCEMGSCIGTGKKSIWVREVRKLTESGHQTSLISTGFETPQTQLAAQMFSRWSQENFFWYMMQHFDIDSVVEYGVTEFPDTETVINPTWRELDRLRNSLQNKLRYRQARFAELTMHPETEDNGPKYSKWLSKKAELLEEVQNYENELKTVKEKLKGTQKHITWGDLPEKDKFLRLLPGRKRLMDTIRMISYRAETAMVGLLRGPTVDSPKARRLLQDLFLTEADIFPDPEKKKLNVHVHSASRSAANRALSKLFLELNNAEVVYPGTDLQLMYHLGGFNASSNGQGVTETS